MYRELLSAPHIGSYSAFLLLGLLGGFLLTRWRAVRIGIRGSHIDNFTLLLAVLSLFGARLFSWWFYFPAGTSLWDALTDSGGGMVFYGGMIFGIATAVLYARFARLSLGNLMYACAPGLALGLALGRVGCFMAGCCWGDLCVSPNELAKLRSAQLAWQLRTVPPLSGPAFPLAVQFPRGAGAYEQHRELGLIDEHADRSRPVHPVQLYEAALALALCEALHLWFHRRRWHGQVVCVLILSYAAIRFSMEFLRGDNSPSYFGFTLSQVISFVMGIVAFSFLLSRRETTSLAAIETSRIT
jgi:phosphatidylglycerol---prolipoprotein diacylglyceryl transferase